MAPENSFTTPLPRRCSPAKLLRWLRSRTAAPRNQAYLRAERAICGWRRAGCGVVFPEARMVARNCHEAMVDIVHVSVVPRDRPEVVDTVRESIGRPDRVDGHDLAV